MKEDGRKKVNAWNNPTTQKPINKDESHNIFEFYFSRLISDVPLVLFKLLKTLIATFFIGYILLAKQLCTSA